MLYNPFEQGTLFFVVVAYNTLSRTTRWQSQSVFYTLTQEDCPNARRYQISISDRISFKGAHTTHATHMRSRCALDAQKFKVNEDARRRDPQTRRRDSQNPNQPRAALPFKINARSSFSDI